jgi:hypothetical protein
MGSESCPFFLVQPGRFTLAHLKKKTALHPTQKHPARALDTKRLQNIMRLQTDFEFRDLDSTKNT